VSLASASPSRHERGEVCGCYTDGVQDPDVCQLTAPTQRIHRRSADAQLASNGDHGEQGALDPSWTRSFVLQRYGLGRLGSGRCGHTQG
jgi:hypothetical protein